MAKKVAPKAAPEVSAGEKVTVRANDTVIEKGGTYHDPAHVMVKGKRQRVNPKPIGENPISVVRTPFVNQRLRSGDLVEVRGGAKEAEKASETEK